MLHVAGIHKTLKAIKENNILRMYVDEAVLKFMGSQEYETSLLQNETIDATIVFIDICSFTSMTEKEAPNVVVNLLNQYFDVMVKEILAQGGYVDKFIGDAVMAVFRGEHHLDSAVDASLAVRSSIDALAKASNDLSFLPKVSVGINTGEVISGNIGSQTLKRLDFTVIGDVVNTAQRLQSVAKAGQILINESCYEKIKESFMCHKVGEEVLKNKVGKTMVYEVIE
jgi:class 3 adenylate cyclase